MRQVFSSPRLENVERVAQLLEDAGIQTRITHARSYRGGLRGNFSYREGAEAKPVPAVWVVRSEDQPQARALLREQGLLDSTRSDTGYRLPAFRTEAPEARVDAGRRRLFRIKLGLIAVIVLVLGLAWFSQLDDGSLPPPRVATQAGPTLGPGESATPDALAVAVLAGELPSSSEEAVCLSVDGADPAPSLLAALPPAPGPVIPLSQCPGGAIPRLSIHGYRAGSGTGPGAITLERSPSAGATPVAETYEVSRGRKGWRVVELL